MTSLTMEYYLIDVMGVPLPYLALPSKQTGSTATFREARSVTVVVCMSRLAYSSATTAPLQEITLLLAVVF